MFQEGFSIALTGLTAGIVFLVVLVILAKVIALISRDASGNAGEMEIPPGFLPETAKAPDSYTVVSARTGAVDFKSIAVAIAAAKAHADSGME